MEDFEYGEWGFSLGLGWRGVGTCREGGGEGRIWGGGREETGWIWIWIWEMNGGGMEDLSRVHADGMV